MTDKKKLCDRLLEWAANENRIRVADEYDGSIYCVLCGAWIDYEPHDPDCMHVDAKALLEAKP